MTPEEYADNLNLSMCKLEGEIGLTKYYKTIQLLTYDEPEVFARTVAMMSERSVEHLFKTAKELMVAGLLTCPENTTEDEAVLSMATKVRIVSLLTVVLLLGALVANIFIWWGA